MPEGSDYVTLARARDAARIKFEDLQRKFEEQERKTPGAQFVPPISGVAPRFVFGRSSNGGKSNRVKSKRNKRRTQRRTRK